MTDQSPNDVFHASSFMQGHNAEYLEQLYARYAQDPNAVDEGWRSSSQASGMRRWMRRPRRRARPGRAPTGRRSPPTTGPTR
jgi:2-oxoglutarate dehydrogenase complex dehydrogenase (E1) component-like enzyme